MNIGLIKKMIDQGYISRRQYPHHELFILNYTSTAQIERKWNEATVMCRGLIVNRDWHIVGRPFKKFFTLEQITPLRNYVHHLYGLKFSELWNMPFRAYEKLDGSLGILYFHPKKREWQVATRGSFASDQAIEANKIWKDMGDIQLTHGKTYMVEIIYPGNRIVVDYGNKRELVLLAVIDNSSGKDDWKEFRKQKKNFSHAEHYPDIQYLSQLETLEQLKDSEGMVLVFENGFRLKFKYDEYLRLHKVLTEVTKRKIWEKLRAGEGFLEWMRDVPEEFYQWIVQTKLELRLEYTRIEDEVAQKLKEIRDKSRHVMADRLVGYKYRGIAFKMLDGGKYEDMIWRLVKPLAEKPFTLLEGE